MSVEAGVNTSELPTVVHAPATEGMSIGRGELGDGGAERVTSSGCVPLLILREGNAISRVGVRGFADAVPG
jgi:hypothetical protein